MIGRHKPESNGFRSGLKSDAPPLCVCALAPDNGIEPSIMALTVPRSTGELIRINWRPHGESNPGTLTDNEACCRNILRTFGRHRWVMLPRLRSHNPAYCFYTTKRMESQEGIAPSLSNVRSVVLYLLSYCDMVPNRGNAPRAILM